MGATVLYSIFKSGMKTTFIEWIYKILQAPLQGMTDSLGGVRTARLQLVVLALSIFIYIPFFKRQDNINFKNEQAVQNAEGQ